MFPSQLRFALAINFLFLCTASSQIPHEAAESLVPVESTLAWSMPEEADIIHMTWAKGPPQLEASRPYDEYLAGYRDRDTLLAFRSQKWGMLLDPRGLRLMSITLQSNDSIQGELLDINFLTEKWDSGELNLAATVGDKIYRAQGSAIPLAPSPRYQSPIHLVESGPWFQHIVIHDLKLSAEDGSTLPAKSRLEIRA